MDGYSLEVRFIMQTENDRADEQSMRQCTTVAREPSEQVFGQVYQP